MTDAELEAASTIEVVILASMERVVILNRGAAGKSTAAVNLGQITGLPTIELDKQFWGPRSVPARLNVPRRDAIPRSSQFVTLRRQSARED